MKSEMTIQWHSNFIAQKCHRTKIIWAITKLINYQPGQHFAKEIDQVVGLHQPRPTLSPTSSKLFQLVQGSSFLYFAADNVKRLLNKYTMTQEGGE